MEMTRKTALPSASQIEKVVKGRARIKQTTAVPFAGCQFEFEDYPDQVVTINIFKNRNENIFEARPSHRPSANPQNDPDQCSAAGENAIEVLDYCLAKLEARISKGVPLVKTIFDH